jgi:hypothetical protein
MKGMVYRHQLATVTEEWMIQHIDKKNHNEFMERKTTITVTSTSVIIKDGGVKVLKKKKAKKTA